MWLLTLALILSRQSVALSDLDIADNCFRKRGNEIQARSALERYRGIFAKIPSWPVAWRLAMAAQFVGNRIEKDSGIKKILFEEGKTAGEYCVKSAPKEAACHFWKAINMILYGQTAGPFKMFFTLPTVREHLQFVADKEPNFAYGGAFRLLGLIHQKLPGILGGSNSVAENYFEQAIAAAPEEPMNYLFLSKLLDEEKKHGRAITVAKLGASLHNPTKDRFESREAHDELVALIAEDKGNRVN